MENTQAIGQMNRDALGAAGCLFSLFIFSVVFLVGVTVGVALEKYLF